MGIGYLLWQETTRRQRALEGRHGRVVVTWVAREGFLARIVNKAIQEDARHMDS